MATRGLLCPLTQCMPLNLNINFVITVLRWHLNYSAGSRRCWSNLDHRCWRVNNRRPFSENRTVIVCNETVLECCFCRLQMSTVSPLFLSSIRFDNIRSRFSVLFYNGCWRPCFLVLIFLYYHTLSLL